MAFYVKFDWFFHRAVYSRCLGLASFDGESCRFFGRLWPATGFNPEYVCIRVKGR